MAIDHLYAVAHARYQNDETENSGVQLRMLADQTRFLLEANKSLRAKLCTMKGKI